MLISFIVTLIIVGVLLYLLNTLVPMDGRIKTVINVVVLLAVFLYALSIFGILPYGNWAPAPRRGGNIQESFQLSA